MYFFRFFWEGGGGDWVTTVKIWVTRKVCKIFFSGKFETQSVSTGLTARQRLLPTI